MTTFDTWLVLILQRVQFRESAVSHLTQRGQVPIIIAHIYNHDVLILHSKGN